MTPSDKEIHRKELQNLDRIDTSCLGAMIVLLIVTFLTLLI